MTIDTINNNTTKNRSNLQAWLVCMSAAMFFFYEFIQMGMFNSISSDLMRDFQITAAQLGTLSATYFYADVAFLLFAGILLDRFSTRAIILNAMFLCVGATFVFAVSTSIWVAGASHFIAGIGNAFCFLSCIKLATRWFPSERLALVIGLMVTLAMAGGVVAQTPLTLLVQAVGWRHAVLIDAALGATIILLIWFFVHDQPRDGKLTIVPPVLPETMSLGESIKAALANSQNWLCGIYTCLLNLPIFILGALWGIMYVTQVHHIPKADASYITMMVFVGTIIGSPFAGWLSDRLGKRRMPMIVAAILSLITIALIIYVPDLSFAQLITLFLLLGFFTSAQIISYPTIAESNPSYLTGTATSIASILIMGGGAVFQPLFGWLMDLHWNHQMLDNTPVYSANDYLLGMAILPVAFIFGLIASLFIRETNGHSYQVKHK